MLTVIGEVASDDGGEVDNTIHTAKVAVIIILESYIACIACKRRVEELAVKLGRATWKHKNAKTGTGRDAKNGSQNFGLGCLP